MEPPTQMGMGCGHSWDLSRREKVIVMVRHAVWTTTSPKQRQKTPESVPSHASLAFANQPPTHTSFAACSHFHPLRASITGLKQKQPRRYPGSFKYVPHCLHRVPRPRTRAHQRIQVPFGDIGRTAAASGCERLLTNNLLCFFSRQWHPNIPKYQYATAATSTCYVFGIDGTVGNEH